MFLIESHILFAMSYEPPSYYQISLFINFPAKYLAQKKISSYLQNIAVMKNNKRTCNVLGKVTKELRKNHGRKGKGKTTISNRTNFILYYPDT